VRKITHPGEPAAGLKADNTKSSGDNHTLHFVIRMRNSLEGTQTSNGGLTTVSLLVDHTTDGSPYDTGRRLEVEGTTTGVGVHALVAELGVLGLVTYERSRDDHLFATDEDDLLSGKELLGDNGAQTTIEVVTAIDDDGLFEDHFGTTYR